MTERVDFSAGGFTAEYGDKMSSVLDIRYKKPAQFEAAVDLGLQGDNLYIGSHKGGFSQITGVRFKDGRNMLSSLETKGEYRPLYLDAQTYMVQRLSSKWQLSLLANVSLTDYTFIPQTRENVFGTTTNLKKLRIYFDGREQDNFLSAYGASLAAVSAKPMISRAATSCRAMPKQAKMRSPEMYPWAPSLPVVTWNMGAISSIHAC